MSVYVSDPDFTLHHGDALAVLRSLPDRSVNCCVTSPPYWGLRDYGVAGQIGLEQTLDEYVAQMVAVFRGVRRVLRDDGTLWLNLGDSYVSGNRASANGSDSRRPPQPDGLKPKDLVGIPWRVAFALQADGWWLRSEIIWAKPNTMPESATDRPTKAHEQVFLLAKSPRYFFDQEAVREPAEWSRRGDQTVRKYAKPEGWGAGADGAHTAVSRNQARGSKTEWMEFKTKEELQAYVDRGRNVRSVWEIATQPTTEAHFATYPEELVRRCILAGSPEGGVVLDPFMGSGTTALAARKHGRRSVGIELNEVYCEIAARRLGQLSLLAGDAA